MACLFPGPVFRLRGKTLLGGSTGRYLYDQGWCFFFLHHYLHLFVLHEYVIILISRLVVAT